MKNCLLFLLFLGLMALSVAEKLVKIEGTSGEFRDIVIDSKGRWYIVKDKKLHTSLDKGVTCKKIRLPSENSVYTGLGIDQFDNIYVQDYKMQMFIVTPLLNETFVFDNITLTYEIENKDEQKLVDRPFALGENVVLLATKNLLMYLKNSLEYPSRVEIPLDSKKEVTNWVRSNYTRFGYDDEFTFFSIGGPRFWVYTKFGYFIRPVAQMLSSVKHMNAVGDHVYCIINGEKQVRLIYFRDNTFISNLNDKQTSYVTTVDGIDLSNISVEDDFILYSPEHDDKTFFYGNLDNKGIVYELGEKEVNGKFKTQVVAQHNLDNVRILSGALGGNKLYFGTTDGVYEMTDILPKRDIIKG